MHPSAMASCLLAARRPRVGVTEPADKFVSVAARPAGRTTTGTGSGDDAPEKDGRMALHR